VLWRRTGMTPPLQVIDKDGTPGRVLDCSAGAGRRISNGKGIATTLPKPVVADVPWSRTSPFDAPGTATQQLTLAPGRWRLSLQYHSQVPLTVTGPGGLDVDLPPSLDGMYLTHQAQGSFWAAGVLRVARRGPVTITISAARPSGLQRLLGVRRQVWLGPLAASRPGSAKRALGSACGAFLDHFTHRSGK
jgi:hypothetical protein